MMGQPERVILIKVDSIKQYNQANFIVNQKMPATKMLVNFVAETERIICNHMAKQKNLAKGVAAPGAYTSTKEVYPPATLKHNVPVTRTGTKKKGST